MPGVLSAMSPLKRSSFSSTRRYVIFESTVSPSANTEVDDIDMAYALIPDEYVVKIDAQGGLWQVWSKATYSDAE